MTEVQGHELIATLGRIASTLHYATAAIIVIGVINTYNLVHSFFKDYRK